MRSLLNGIRKKFSLLSIGQKLTLIVILSSLVPAVIVISIVSGQIYNMTLANNLRKNQQDIASITPRIDRTIDRIIADVDSIKSEEYYQELFSRTGSDFQSQKKDSSKAFSFYRRIRTITDYSDINCIRFYLDLPADHSFFSGRDESIFQPMSRIAGSYWHGIFQGSRILELFAPDFYLSRNEKNELGDMAYIIPVPCYDEKGQPLSCYLAAYFSSSVFMDILESNISSSDSVFYIITDRDATVVTTDSKLSGLYYQRYQEIYKSLISSNNFIEKEVLGETVYFNFQTISRPSWYLINAVPKGYILKETIDYDMRIFLVAISIFIAAMIYTLRLSKSLGERISSVIHTMSRTKEGHLVPMEEPEIFDEVGELISTYNYMTRQQEALTRDLQETADELRVAEVNALQAQINPHFLYNTLDTIHWMAVSGKTSDISTMVHNLSRFYKLTLGKDMTSTTLHNELEQVSAYVDLQNARFDGAIDLIIDIPEDMEDCRIPRLTLQPIVENSILHGIREKESQTGSVIITGWVEGDDIFLLVSDDGIGISPAVIPKILTREGTGIKTTGTNIAIYNVHHRLQLLYGQDYGLTYESLPGRGTDVRIRIPAEPGS